MDFKFNDQKIKELSDLLIKQISFDEFKMNTILKDIDSIFVDVPPRFIHVSKNHIHGKKYTTVSQTIGKLNFRISREQAKKLDLYPWHKYSFKIRVHEYHYKEKDLKPLGNNELRSFNESLSHIRIAFNCIHTRKGEKRKRFEIFKLLKYIYLIDSIDILKIEKRLLDLS